MKNFAVGLYRDTRGFEFTCKACGRGGCDIDELGGLRSCSQCDLRDTAKCTKVRLVAGEVITQGEETVTVLSITAKQPIGIQRVQVEFCDDCRGVELYVCKTECGTELGCKKATGQVLVCGLTTCQLIGPRCTINQKLLPQTIPHEIRVIPTESCASCKNIKEIREQTEARRHVTAAPTSLNR